MPLQSHVTELERKHQALEREIQRLGALNDGGLNARREKRELRPAADEGL